MDENIDILMTVNIAEELQSKLELISPRLKIHIHKASRVDEIPSDIWAITEVLYTGRVLPAPELTPNLRWIQFHLTGVDHAREAPILQREGLVATTMSGASSSQVAEYITLMILALGHRLPDMIDHQRKNLWPKDRWERFLPYELNGSTVGIVGYGSIGRQVARLMYSFGATVFATKRNAMHPDDYGYSIEGFGDPGGDFVHRLYPAEAIISMAKVADFLVVCVPLTNSTRNLIDADVFQVMKETAFIIDASRGGVTNHNALVAAIKEKRIAGAALDVFPDEPLPVDHPLWKLSNVIITPHISGISPKYDEKAMDLFAENLRRYLKKEPLLNQIDVDLGY